MPTTGQFAKNQLVSRNDPETWCIRHQLHLISTRQIIRIRAKSFGQIAIVGSHVLQIIRP